MKINSRVNEKLASFNDELKIKLRLIKLKNKHSIYIDYHANASRERKYLSLYISGDVNNWQEDSAILLQAREIQRLFEEKLKLERDKFKLNYGKMDANFVDYFEQMRIIGRKYGKVFDMLEDDYLNRRIKEWIINCGINKVITFHCGRHTFATMGITAGMSIYEVSALLGHTEIKHTLIYAKLVNKKKDLAALKYPEMF